MRPLLLALLLSSTAAMAQDPQPAQASASRDTVRQLNALMDVFLKVREAYVDKVDDKTLLEGAINGMLESLDPHSSYLNARDSVQMRTQTEGEYGGLGLTFSTEDGAVKVIAPTDDTPASRAGIKAGDFITHVDGKLVFGTTMNEAADLMRGPAGSAITLTVVRPGAPKALSFKLVREVIKVRPVRHEVRGDVGVIRVASFNRLTGPATRDAIQAVERQLGPRLAGFVLDLRSNPGGLLDQAIEVSDAFMERGEIVSQRGREKDDIERFYARGDDLARGRPLVVLVDEGSASAAEIVAGALQDSRRAVVLGQRTYGKGSVQTLIPLSADTGLRLTTARYFTPSGRSVQENGIDPDIIVPQLTDPTRGDRPRVREADLRNHLINELKVDDRIVEDDGKPDPRFAATPEDLKKRGITDFQLDYAVKLVERLAPTPGPALRTAAAPAAAGTAAK